MTMLDETLDLAVHTIATLRGYAIEQELPDGTVVAEHERAWHLTKPCGPDRPAGAVKHVVVRMGIEGERDITEDERADVWREVEAAFERHDVAQSAPTPDAG